MEQPGSIESPSIATQLPDYSLFLMEKLSEFKSQNSQHSLRGFARKLKVDPGALSSILGGKRPLSLKQALKIAQELQLEETQKELLLQSVVTHQRVRRVSKALGIDEVNGLRAVTLLVSNGFGRFL